MNIYAKVRDNIEKVVKRKTDIDYIGEFSKVTHTDNNAALKNEILKSINIDAQEAKMSVEIHALNKALDKIKNKITELYGMDMSDVFLVEGRTTNQVSAYMIGDGILLDSLMEAMFHEILMVVLVWANHENNENMFGRFFNYLTTVLYGTAIDCSAVNIYNFEYIVREVKNNSNIINIASLCEWFVYYFCLAHEVAHNYFRKIDEQFSDDFDEEYKCDSMAYDIVLRLMQDETKDDVRDRELFDYCFLAPIMFMDCIDLFYYASYVINGVKIENDGKHPPINKRKSNLFSIPYSNNYFFDCDEGNAVYNAFIEIVDRYKIQLLSMKSSGDLDTLIKYIEENKNG